jgi:transcription initiation factor IIE alpha subunit|tara:strand:+ start:67 stop:378 length:312 start_codon:yes stop_codon:yes gene_type:complete
MKKSYKQDKLIPQDKLMLEILARGGEFTELELGKILMGKQKRGMRSLISAARKNGHFIADKLKQNKKTGRLNKSYYLETNELKYIIWARQNGMFNFKVGAPKY